MLIYKSLPYSYQFSMLNLNLAFIVITIRKCLQIQVAEWHVSHFYRIMANLSKIIYVYKAIVYTHSHHVSFVLCIYDDYMDFHCPI